MEPSAKDCNEGSLDRYMTMYETATTFLFSSGPLGLQGIKETYQKVLFYGGKPNQQLKYDDLVIRPLGIEYALLMGQFVLSGNGLKE